LSEPGLGGDWDFQDKGAVLFLKMYKANIFYLEVLNIKGKRLHLPS